MATGFLPAKQNFPLYEKATFRYEFQWVDRNGKVRTPHDLTGYSGEANLVGDDGSELLLSTGNGGVIFEEGAPSTTTRGLVELYISQATVETLTFKKAKYTLYVKEPNPPKDRFPLMAGLFHQVKQPQ